MNFNFGKVFKIMKIIGTIKHRFNEDYISKVSNLYELGITDYRFNYSKIEGNLSKEELFYQDVLKIQSIGNDRIRDSDYSELDELHKSIPAFF